MKTLSTTLKVLTCAIFIMALSSVAQAQATRTWVSGVGDDVNPCSRTAPCKTFAGAISKTAIAGEINALDSGGFGAVTITKSMTIDGGEAGHASVLASFTTGVTINVGVNANDPERRVTLRRLSINGTGSSGGVGQKTGIRGINFIAGKNVFVENCYIQHFVNEGIRVSLTATDGYLSVKDTNIQNCSIGISTATSTGFTLLTADRVRIERMTGNGITLGLHAFASIRNSFIQFNGADGIGMLATNTDGKLFSENNMINSNTSAGIRAGGAGSGIVISKTTMSLNSSALATGGGTVGSHQNNSIDGTIGTAPAPLGQQ
jgi:hypothetical protein